MSEVEMGFLGKDGMMARRERQLKYQDNLAYGDSMVPPDPDPANEEFPQASNHSALAEAPVDAPEHMDMLTDVDLPDPGPGELPQLSPQEGGENPEDQGLDLDPELAGAGSEDLTGLQPDADPTQPVDAGAQSPENPAAAPGVETADLAEARRKVGQIMSHHFFGGV